MKILHVGPVKLKHASGLPESILGLASAQIDIGLKIGLLSPLPLTQDNSMKQIPGLRLLRSPYGTALVSEHMPIPHYGLDRQV